MLMDPNVDSPLEQEIASQLRDNPDEFAKTAKEWTAQHASGN